MTTTLTPPPLPPQSGQPAQPGHTPPSERRSSSRVVAIIAICLGAVLVLGTVITGVISIIRTAAVHTTTLTASIDGIRALDIDARAADVDIVYGDVAEATLRVVGSQGDWTFERQGDTLVVSSDRQWWGRWGWFREGDDVTLTLPTGTRGLDADFDVDGGSLTATGDYGDLALTLDAGSLRIEGSAESLTTDVSAGPASSSRASTPRRCRCPPARSTDACSPARPRRRPRCRSTSRPAASTWHSPTRPTPSRATCRPAASPTGSTPHPRRSTAST